jgi:hypothetical protein
MLFRPQGNGLLQDAFNVIGADFAYKAVDDSLDATHDGDATTVDLGRGDQASFPIFLGVNPELIPESVTLRVVAKKFGPAQVVIQLGFVKGTTIGLSGSDIILATSYIARTRAFPTNPVTGAAWAPGDLAGLEALVQRTAPLGTAVVTLFNGSLEHELPTNYELPNERMGSILA